MDEKYTEEAKRIAEELKATEEHVHALEREEKSEKQYMEDLKEQYEQVFLRRNLERLTAFRDECLKREKEVSQQLMAIKEERRLLRIQLKNKEVKGRDYNDRVHELAMKGNMIRKLFSTYFDSSIAELIGITRYDKNIIIEFVHGTRKNRRDEKEMTIEDVYKMRLEILNNPTDFSQRITHFGAGGLGACAYGKYITIAELVRCWEHNEFRFKCSTCKENAYIYQFAGHVNGGGYWEIKAYCPKCDKHIHYTRKGICPVSVHWSSLKNIADAVSRQIQKETESK